MGSALRPDSGWAQARLGSGLVSARPNFFESKIAEAEAKIDGRLLGMLHLTQSRRSEMAGSVRFLGLHHLQVRQHRSLHGVRKTKAELRRRWEKAQDKTSEVLLEWALLPEITSAGNLK